MDLQAHLKLFGIQRFEDDRYWLWGGSMLGPKRIEQLEKTARAARADGHEG